MNPFTSRRAPHEQAALDEYNDGVKRARAEHAKTCAKREH